MTNEIRWKQRFENLQQSIKNIDETCECIKKEGLNKITPWHLSKSLKSATNLLGKQ